MFTAMSTAERICFITGFHRSGTTVLTEAVASAVPAPMLTVGDLAQFMPALAELLDSLQSRSVPVDRGVDGRPVSSTMPEEYCVYLASRGRGRKLRYGSRAKADLQALADAVAAREDSRAAVMKNPWDTANEARLLKDFPHASVVIVRRALPEIEASQRAAFARERNSDEYMGTLLPGEFVKRIWQFAHRGRLLPRLINAISVWRLRLRTLRLASQVHRLPHDRTALLSYDEFKTDARAAAQWASHLLDPDVLAEEFAARCAPFGAEHQPAQVSRVVAAIDRYWERSWERTRAQHARARS